MSRKKGKELRKIQLESDEEKFLFALAGKKDPLLILKEIKEGIDEHLTMVFKKDSLKNGLLNMEWHKTRETEPKMHTPLLKGKIDPKLFINNLRKLIAPINIHDPSYKNIKVSIFKDEESFLKEYFKIIRKKAVVSLKKEIYQIFEEQVLEIPISELDKHDFKIAFSTDMEGEGLIIKDGENYFLVKIKEFENAFASSFKELKLSD